MYFTSADSPTFYAKLFFLLARERGRYFILTLKKYIWILIPDWNGFPQIVKCALFITHLEKSTVTYNDDNPEGHKCRAPISSHKKRLNGMAEIQKENNNTTHKHMHTLGMPKGIHMLSFKKSSLNSRPPY